MHLGPDRQVYLPMRVAANHRGAEVTLFRLPDMTDAAFARDDAWVERDLAALKRLVEIRAPGDKPQETPHGGSE